MLYITSKKTERYYAVSEIFSDSGVVRRHWIYLTDAKLSTCDNEFGWSSKPLYPVTMCPIYLNSHWFCFQTVRASDPDNAIYAWFCDRIRRNVHVIFTMNPANDDYCNRSGTSPALFNRCVVDWFGIIHCLALRREPCWQFRSQATGLTMRCTK